MLHCTSFTAALALLLASPTAVKGWVWSVEPTTGTAPRVSGQAAAASSTTTTTTTTTSDFQKNDPVLLLFGGLTGAAGAPTTDQTWTYDKTKGGWDRLVETTTSRRPRQRMYAASAIVSDKFYLLGGWDPGAPGSGGEFLDDIWCFDLQTKDWKQLDVKLPYPVSRHAGCAIDKNRVVLHTFKGVLVYDCDSGILTEQPTTGDAPDGLSMCAIAPFNNGNSLLLFGGSTKTQQLSGDTYVLDITTWKWNKQQQQLKDQEEDVAVSGPGPRASACAASVGGNQVVVFGGASIGSEGYSGGMGLVPLQDTWLATVVVQDNNNKVVEWTKLDTETSPEGRVAATLCALGDGTFLMQGGYNPISKSTYEESWVLKEQE